MNDMIRFGLFNRSNITQKEVRKRMNDIISNLDRGTYVAPSKLSVKQWLEIWIQEYTQAIKPATVVSYAQHIHNRIIPALGAVRLEDLNVDRVQKFYNDLLRGDRPLSPKTVKNIHGVLHSALKQAVRIGYIRSNPTEACVLPRIEKPEMRPLDAPEIRALMNSLGDDAYSTLIKVVLFTGMRQGEILGLQWSCVDFDRGQILINKQLNHPRKKGDVYCLASLKNDKPRTIKPAPFVMNLLRDYRLRQLEARIAAGSLWNDAGIPDLVFTNEFGHYLCYSAVWRHYKIVLQHAGLPDNRFHDLRHPYVKPTTKKFITFFEVFRAAS